MERWNQKELARSNFGCKPRSHNHLSWGSALEPRIFYYLQSLERWYILVWFSLRWKFSAPSSHVCPWIYMHIFFLNGILSHGRAYKKKKKKYFFNFFRSGSFWWVLDQHSLQQCASISTQIAGHPQFSSQNSLVEVLIVFPPIGKFTCQNCEEQYTQRPDISRLSIVLLFFYDLRRQVRGCPTESGEFAVFGWFGGEPEVNKFDLSEIFAK